MTIVTKIIKTNKVPGMQDHNVAMFPVPQEKLLLYSEKLSAEIRCSLKRERGCLENAQ